MDKSAFYVICVLICVYVIPRCHAWKKPKCYQETKEGNCWKWNRTIYRYSGAEKKCVPFLYKGCEPSPNFFYYLWKCKLMCEDFESYESIKPTPYVSKDYRCHMPYEFGFCKEWVTYYKYMTYTNKCEDIISNTCQRTEDLFLSMNKCRFTCEPGFITMPPTSTFTPLAEECTLNKAVGNCTESHEKFFFSMYYKQCVPFTYTGCHGNQNNFPTLEACEEKCQYFGPPPTLTSTHTPSRADCYLPRHYGRWCKRFSNRYFFHPGKGYCRRFLYVGCNGNHNNFWNFSECTSMCDPTTTTPESTTTTTTALPVAAPKKKTAKKGKNKKVKAKAPKGKKVPKTCLLTLPSCAVDTPKGKLWYYNKADKACKKYNFKPCGKLKFKNKFPNEAKCKKTCRVP